MKRHKIRYTLRHRKAFRKIEKELVGHNTIRGYLHDIDKLLLYVVMDCKRASKLHRSYSRHHAARARTYMDFVQMVIDWECARYTKPDKQMNARETLDKLYPELKNDVLPIIIELGL